MAILLQWSLWKIISGFCICSRDDLKVIAIQGFPFKKERMEGMLFGPIMLMSFML